MENSSALFQLSKSTNPWHASEEKLNAILTDMHDTFLQIW